MENIKLLHLEITNNCNGNCWYCGNPKMERERGYLSLENAEKIADIIKGRQEFILLHYYGEPLLHPQIDDIIKIMGKRNIKCGMFSNGELLTEEMIDKLIEAKLFSITITLNRFMPLKQVECLISKKSDIQLELVVINLPEGSYVANMLEINSWAKEMKKKYGADLKIRGAKFLKQEKVNSRADCCYKDNKNDCLMRLKNEYTCTWDCKVFSCLKDFDGESLLGDFFEVYNKLKYENKKCQY